MNHTLFIPIFMLFLILYITKRNETAALKNILKKKSSEEKERMVELAKKFIDKECIVYTFNSQLTGTVKEVGDTGIILDKSGCLEAVNLDFVVRIREYPRNKKGKKKSVILD